MTRGALLAAVFNRASEVPALAVVIGCGLTCVFGVPAIVAPSFSPSLRPIRDLAEGTERVAAGDYSQRLPVVQDDDLGALATSFNRMQAGLAERQRIQAAFGTYVDPTLASRLLEQGDDVFTGDRREVTVMFVDVRDFTPFAEANSAEDTVARLNAVFEIVLPAVVEAGGHVNKFLGDGALAVFGAPNDLANHADAAVAAAVLIQRLVAARFGGALRIGIGINTVLAVQHVQHRGIGAAVTAPTNSEACHAHDGSLDVISSFDRFRSITCSYVGGAKGIRTPDLLDANESRYQLRHSP
jgi:adenylate cyclase